MANVWKEFENLLPKDPLLIATVTSHLSNNNSLVTFLDGGTSIVRGQEVAVGNKAFIQTGKIQGPAPNLSVVNYEI